MAMLVHSKWCAFLLLKQASHGPSQGSTFIVAFLVKCSVVFHLKIFFFLLPVMLVKRYIQVSLGNIVATFLGKGCQLSLLSDLFVVVCISLSFPLMCKTCGGANFVRF